MACFSLSLCMCVSGVFASGLLRGDPHGPVHAGKQSATGNRRGTMSLCRNQISHVPSSFKLLALTEA